MRTDDWLRILYLVLWLALVGGGLSLRRIRPAKAVYYSFLWLMIIVGLVLFYELMTRM